MVGDDIPFFLMHLDHHAQKMGSAFDAKTGRPVHPVFSKTDLFEYVGRNSTPGRLLHLHLGWHAHARQRQGHAGSPQASVPNGSYKITLRVLKPLGDEGNPAHWETWTSPRSRWPGPDAAAGPRPAADRRRRQHAAVQRSGRCRRWPRCGRRTTGAARDLLPLAAAARSTRPTACC
jgi:hypothetical protein